MQNTLKDPSVEPAFDHEWSTAYGKTHTHVVAHNCQTMEQTKTSW